MSTTRAARSAGVAIALALSLSGSVTAGAAPHRALAVTGFQEAGDPSSRISRSAAALTTVGVDGVNISPDGSTVSVPNRAALQARDRAVADQLRTEILVGNFDSTINDFSEADAHRLLSRPANIDSVAAAMAHSVTTQHWGGVSVDLEALRGRDRAGLVSFLKALRHDLPASKTLSVCVSNATRVATYRSWGYDLPAIGAVVSRVILMAYDEHGSWENTPGPVGSIAWQRAGLNAMLTAVPAAKIDLGQAGYGYAWRPHSNYQVSDAGARSLVTRTHATAHFSERVGEWSAHLPDGSTIWWADARSYAMRVALAKRLRLHGLAVWSLGLSDPIH